MLLKYLMIRNHNHSIREMTFYPPILRLLQLSSHRCITTYSHDRRTPPLCQRCNVDSKGLFRECHIGVVEILIVPVQRHPEELRKADPTPVSGVSQYGERTYEQVDDRK
jgi:hypothetical protein